jgi:uncharacterized protein YdcH (DUF465 family)
MTPELSAFQIVETCTAIKKQLKTLSSDGAKNIIYEIYYQNPSISQDWQMYAKGNTKEQGYEKFDESFDYITQHPNGAIRIRVVFKDSHYKPLADQSIPILSLTDRIAPPQQNMMPDQQPVSMPVQQTMPQPQQQQQSFGNIGTLLGLMGFSGLQGTDDSPMAALGAVLQVRDGLKDAQYERQDLMRKYEEKITENVGLKQKVEGLEKDVAEKDARIDKLEDENDDLQDRIEDLEEKLQQRETISGIGSIAIQKLAGSLIRRNPEKISSLLGISTEDMLGMIDGAAEQPAQAATQPIPTVEVEQDDPRTIALKPFIEFAKTLSDDDWQMLTTILDVFRSDARTIQAIMTLMQRAQQANGAQEEVEVQEPIELEE